MNKEKKDNLWELIKFLITGVICAAADFLTTALFHKICENLPYVANEAISLLCGFIVGVILNYILSTFWVFKGKQDNNVTKSKKFIILFVLFSAVAYGLSFGTYWICWIVINSSTGITITDVTPDYIFKFTFWGDALFWLFALAFVLKTFVGLIWNYFTRKYILYKRKDSDEAPQIEQ
ncbi:MAG: GtrA family protein [Bacilli bacterium]|nr:GtrA family protein [Bacilli bacterium]